MNRGRVISTEQSGASTTAGAWGCVTQALSWQGWQERGKGVH